MGSIPRRAAYEANDDVIGETGIIVGTTGWLRLRLAALTFYAAFFCCFTFAHLGL
jgi:hypothetical protein